MSVANPNVTKTIIINQTVEKIELLKKDVKQVDSENLLRTLPLVQENEKTGTNTSSQGIRLFHYPGQQSQARPL